MLKIEYGEHRARISVLGEIDEELVVDLVDRIRHLCEKTYYREVELEVASSGGSANALDYFIDAAAGFRERGWTIATRALTGARSAAAILVSMGDRRVASRSSLLQYHTGRVRLGAAVVTAPRAAALSDALDSVDRRLIELLAVRARRDRLDPSGAQPCIADFHDSDWPVVAALGRIAFNADRPKPPQQLLTKLRGRVADTLKSRSAKALTRLYMELFAFDTPISAALAVELRLLDAVVPTGGADTVAEDARAAASEGADAQGMVCIPEWRELFPHGRIKRELLCRHTLIMGESGSGKTVSGILPAVKALFDDANRVGCALVIDPKRDIVPLLWHFERQGADVRTIDMSTHDGSWILNLMAGPHSIEDDLANDRFLTAAKKILIRTSSLTPNHSAGVLGGVSNTAAEPYWGNAGARMAQTVLALVLLVLQHRDRLFGSRLAVRLGDSGNRARQALVGVRPAGGFHGAAGRDRMASRPCPPGACRGHGHAT